MIRSTLRALWTISLVLIACAASLCAQRPPYDVFPSADQPYYRALRGFDSEGELVYPVNYTVWIRRA